MAAPVLAPAPRGLRLPAARRPVPWQNLPKTHRRAPPARPPPGAATMATSGGPPDESLNRLEALAEAAAPEAAPEAAAAALRSSTSSLAAAAPPSTSSLLSAITRPLSILYRFSRPHTMLGTTISILSVSALALNASTLTHPATLRAVGSALVAALLMNVSIVGVNQIYDIQIDALNKPELPLPAGDLSVKGAVAICVGSAAASLALGATTGSLPLLATLAGSLLLGLLYSVDLPGLRWKRHPALAAGCILAVRAVGVQAGFFAHVRGALAAAGVASALPALSSSTLPPALAYAVTAMLAFSLAIAVLKDTPDVEGDARAGVRTLPVRAGAPAVFKGAVGSLCACYALATGWTLAACTTPVTRLIAAGGHAAAGVALTCVAARTDAGDKASLSKAYMGLWALFYLEYLLIPFVR